MSPSDDKREARAKIATEIVRGLLLINGGGAVALLAFVQAIWPVERGIVGWLLASLCCFAVGALLCPVYNHVRVQVSLERCPEWRERVVGISSLALFVSGVVLAAIAIWAASITSEGRQVTTPTTSVHSALRPRHTGQAESREGAGDSRAPGTGDRPERSMR